MEPQVIVEPYTLAWATAFRKLEVLYREHLGGLIAAVHHVGSTSVPGLAAKPVIDIDLVPVAGDAFAELVARLDVLGYDYLGEMGITDRHAFRRRPGSAADGGDADHHLYVCLADSVSLRNHLLLRDFLRANDAAARQYGALKCTLAARFPDDMRAYTAGKTAFIIAILEAAGLEPDALEQIRLENTGSS